MRLREPLFACACLVILNVVVACHEVSAGDYVWARSPWGSSNINGHYSSMSNGYGGYYVPRDGYGNNYESRGNFTNANGYIIPANSGVAPQPAQSHHVRMNRRRHRQ